MHTKLNCNLLKSVDELNRPPPPPQPCNSLPIHPQNFKLCGDITTASTVNNMKRWPTDLVVSTCMKPGAWCRLGLTLSMIHLHRDVADGSSCICFQISVCTLSNGNMKLNPRSSRISIMRSLLRSTSEKKTNKFRVFIEDVQRNDAFLKTGVLKYNQISVSTYLYYVAIGL